MNSDVDFLVKLRDAACMVMDACEARLETLAPGAQGRDSAVKEETFLTLKWDPQKGEKLGEYETSDPKANPADSFQHALDILQKSEATIKARYHGPGYHYAYWIYGDRIFRQKLKEK